MWGLIQFIILCWVSYRFILAPTARGLARFITDYKRGRYDRLPRRQWHFTAFAIAFAVASHFGTSYAQHWFDTSLNAPAVRTEAAFIQPPHCSASLLGQETIDPKIWKDVVSIPIALSKKPTEPQEIELIRGRPYIFVLSKAKKEPENWFYAPEFLKAVVVKDVKPGTSIPPKHQCAWYGIDLDAPEGAVLRFVPMQLGRFFIKPLRLDTKRETQLIIDVVSAPARTKTSE